MILKFLIMNVMSLLDTLKSVVKEHVRSCICSNVLVNYRGNAVPKETKFLNSIYIIVIEVVIEIARLLR